MWSKHLATFVYKILASGGDNELHIQNLLFLCLLLPEEFKNLATVSLRSAITTGHNRCWRDVFRWHLPTPLCLQDFEIFYFTGKEQWSNLGATSLTWRSCSPRDAIWNTSSVQLSTIPKKGKFKLPYSEKGTKQDSSPKSVPDSRIRLQLHAKGVFSTGHKL